MLQFLNSFNDLGKRVITALAGFILIMFAITWNEWTYFALFFLICLFSLAEFYNLVRKAGFSPIRYYGILVGMAIYSIPFLIEHHNLDFKYHLLIYPLIFIIFITRLYQPDNENAFADVAFTVLGLVHIVLPFGLLHMAVFKDDRYDYRLILSILFLIWIYDIAAYFAGKYLGRNKLFKRISPNKTWEGVIGGSLAAVGMLWILAQSFDVIRFQAWFGVVLIVVVIGTYGDLTISLYKRSLSIKDSSNAIPGHGGFLDRFDSLFLSAPFIALYLKFFC